MKDVKKILVPVDGSAHAEEAVVQAVFFAQLCQASLTLLHVVDLNRKISAFEQVSTGGYIPAELKEDGYRLILAAQKKIPPNIQTENIVEIGAPAESIVEISNTADYDLIIMGSRGSSTLERVFMGSVSQYVLAHAACPVMVIR